MHVIYIRNIFQIKLISFVYSIFLYLTTQNIYLNKQYFRHL